MKLTGGERAKLSKEKDNSGPQQFNPPPVPKDAIGTIAWANQAAAMLLERVLLNADGSLSFKEQLRYAADLIGRIGVTHSKALADERILKLEKEMGMAKGQADDQGLEPDPENA